MGKMNNPDLSPSTNLAYTIGAFLGDGTTGIGKQSQNHYIMLQVKSKTFAEKFAVALSNIGLRPKIYRLHTRDRWLTTITSKKLHNFLKRTRNSLSELLTFLNTPELKQRFVEGFLDAEGTVCMRKDNRWKKPYSYLFVGFYNSNRNLMELVANTIRQIGFNCGISEHREGAYQGYILGSQGERKRFLNFIYHDQTPVKQCEIIEEFK